MQKRKVTGSDADASASEYEDMGDDDAGDGNPRINRMTNASTWMGHVAPNGSSRGSSKLRMVTSRPRITKESIAAVNDVQRNVSKRKSEAMSPAELYLADRVLRPDNSPLYAIIDTGSEKSVVPSVYDLTVVVEEYDAANEAAIVLAGVSGANLSITALG
jgi:hypothetical protein